MISHARRTHTVETYCKLRIERATETYERLRLTSASRTATTSAIVLRLIGLLFQLPLITLQTLLESSGWVGLLGRRPFNSE